MYKKIQEMLNTDLVLFSFSELLKFDRQPNFKWKTYFYWGTQVDHFNFIMKEPLIRVINLQSLALFI